MATATGPAARGPLVDALRHADTREGAHRVAEHRQEEPVRRYRVHHDDQCGHPCQPCALGHQKADRIRGV
jgi:hypothetical protein